MDNNKYYTQTVTPNIIGTCDVNGRYKATNFYLGFSSTSPCILHIIARKQSWLKATCAAVCLLCNADIRQG